MTSVERAHRLASDGSHPKGDKSAVVQFGFFAHSVRHAVWFVQVESKGASGKRWHKYCMPKGNVLLAALQVPVTRS